MKCCGGLEQRVCPRNQRSDAKQPLEKMVHIADSHRSVGSEIGTTAEKKGLNNKFMTQLASTLLVLLAAVAANGWLRFVQRFLSTRNYNSRRTMPVFVFFLSPRAGAAAVSRDVPRVQPVQRHFRPLHVPLAPIAVRHGRHGEETGRLDWLKVWLGLLVVSDDWSVNMWRRWVCRRMPFSLSFPLPYRSGQQTIIHLFWCCCLECCLYSHSVFWFASWVSRGTLRPPNSGVQV